MSMTQTIAEGQHHEILEASINRRMRAVVSHRLAEGWRTYKASFVSGSRLAKAVVIRLQIRDDTPEQELPPCGKSVGITFRLGHKKCMFTAVIQSSVRERDTCSVTVAWPEQLHYLQRRAYERVTPPKGTVVAVRFWPEDSASRQPDRERNVRHGQLEDLSAGGMRVKTGDLSDIEVGQTYRCVVAPKPGAPPLIVDAVLRHREATDRGRASLGFHFLGLEASAEGRKLLDQIVKVVTQFQRARLRRRRTQ
jgi:c-di-GMP-binding flagellar brake protein YcgR